MIKGSRGLPDSTIVAIDVGTTKVCVLVAQALGDGQLEIIGIGKTPSQGLARGVVVDVIPAVQSIKEAIKEAELMSGKRIESAYVGISGSHIRARNSQGVVALKHKEIRPHDITQVIGAAKAVPLPEGHSILHVLPQFFVIDGDHKVRDPRGMFGIRLEAQVHIISGALASVQNLVRCCEMAGVKIRDVILEPLASAEAVLSEDEKELGAFMLDIGGGTSDFAFYHQGTIRHTKVFPVAGNLFTQDIALCLRTTVREAERIKKEYGWAHESCFSHGSLEIEKIQGDEKQTIDKTILFDILQPRACELFALVLKEVTTHQLSASAGLVLTGGGSLLAGLEKVAQETLAMPVRVAYPRVRFGFKEALDSPLFATSYGLLIYAAKKHNLDSLDRLDGPFVARVFARMKSWVVDFF